MDDKDIETYKAQLQMEVETHKATLSKEHERYRAEWQSRLEHWKETRSRERELYPGVFMFAVLGIKTLIIVNGGGAIAIIAFLGHIWTGNADLAPAMAVILAWPLGLYVAGVGLGLLTAMLSYLAQVSFAEPESERMRRLWGSTFRGLAIAAAAAGFAAFVAAGFEAIHIFQSVPLLK